MTVMAAIVGCGNIAGGYDEAKKDKGFYSHAGAYATCPEVQLVAAADLDSSRLSQFGRFWNIPHLYKDVTDLLKNHAIDILSVAVPDEQHSDVIKKALDKRPPKVLFVEKPLTKNRQETRELLDHAKAKGSHVVLNCQRRWDKGHRQVRDLIASGQLGQIVSVSAYYVKGLYHVGCTVVNSIRFLVSEIESVQTLAGNHQESVQGDPSVDAALYLSNGATAVMMGVDRYGYNYSLFEIDILGTKGRVRLTDNGDTITVSNVEEYAHYSGFRELKERSPQPILSEMGNAIPNGVQEMVRFLTDSKDLSRETSGEEGYLDICVLEAIAESRAHAGARITVRR